MPKNTYQIVVNNSFTYDLSEGDLASCEIIRTSFGYQMRYKNKNYNLDVHREDKIHCTVSVNGVGYTVQIKNDLAQLIDKMGFQKQAEKNIKQIHAPMPGLVLDILVEVGQEVGEDTPLLVLEAMKMENSMLSPVSGVIKSIEIQKGDAVNKGQLLVEFE